MKDVKNIAEDLKADKGALNASNVVHLVTEEVSIEDETNFLENNVEKEVLKDTDKITVAAEEASEPIANSIVQGNTPGVEVQKSNNSDGTLSRNVVTNGYSCKPCLFWTSRESNFKDHMATKHRNIEQKFMPTEVLHPPKIFIFYCN